MKTPPTTVPRSAGVADARPMIETRATLERDALLYAAAVLEYMAALPPTLDDAIHGIPDNTDALRTAAQVLRDTAS